MNTRISKLNLYNHYEITINKIDCTYENIKKIISIFKFNYIVLTIDSLERSSNVILLIKSLKLHFTLSSMTSEIVEVRVVVPAELIYLVLEEAVKGDPENLFISNLFNDANWTKMIIESPQTLYLREYSDVIIIISRDINCIYLSFRKKKYNYREVLLKINNILLCL